MYHLKSKSWTLRRAVATVSTAMALGVAFAQPVAAEELLYSLIAPNHPLNAPVFGKWAENVAAATEGRVTIKFLDTAAAPPPRIYDAIRTDVVDAGHTFIGFLGKAAPLMQVGMLPMMAGSAESNAVALSRTYDTYLKDKEQLDGVKILGFLSNPAGVTCSLKEPITSVESLRALKMWSLPGYAAQAMEALEVPVVAGPATEMYELVSKGTVDGFNGVSIGDAIAFNTAQYAKSCTMVEGGVFRAVFAVMINKDKWDAIPAADQKAIEAASGEAFGRLSAASDAWAEATAKAYTDQGGQIIDASPELTAELATAWAPMTKAWIDGATAAGLDGQAVFDFYKAQVAAVEAE